MSSRYLIKKINYTTGYFCQREFSNLLKFKGDIFSYTCRVVHFPGFRHFRCSRLINMAKSSKKGKSIESDNAVDINIQLPNVQDIGTQMDKRIKKMSDDFLHFRAGQASPDILSQITVEAYGSRVLLPETSQVTVVSPTKLSLSVFDPLLVKSVANSILTSNLDLTPEVEGNTISIKIPKPSKEARETMAKAVAKAAEKTKTEIRQIRKIALDELKSIKGQVSEDDTRRLSKEVENVTEAKVAKVTQLQTEKEKEILKT